MKQLILLLPLAAMACAPASAPEPEATAGPVRTPYAFEVELTLTPRTIEKLAAMSEQVTVSAMYWGEPRPGVQGDEMGQVNLGSDDINVQPANRGVLVPGSAIDPKALETDVEGPPQVLVNVYTARLAHEDNLINCEIYEGPVSMAQAKPVAIECDLIEPPAPEPV
jgi:hypothetical protein